MKFIESTHEYFNSEGKKYGGVTSFIDTFTKKKDWDAIAKKYVESKTKDQLIKDLAKKWDISLDHAKRKWGDIDFDVKAIRGVWKDKSERSLVGGNMWHEFKELQKSKEAQTVYNPVVKDSKVIMDLRDIQPDTTYLELGVYSHLHEMMGQIDRVKITKKRRSRISDYKTNLKDIEEDGGGFFNRRTRKKQIEKFLPPISHIPVNDYYKYALQLSLYAYMLELHGIPNESLEVEHVRTKYKSPDQVTKYDIILHEELDLNRVRVYDRVEIIALPYLQKEAASLLKIRQLRL